MKPIFVDTSALIALGNKRDRFYSQARQVRDRLNQSGNLFITTNAVLLELGNAFSTSHLSKSAVRLIESIQSSQLWNCLPVDSLMDKGFKKYSQMEDKDWSLVDCISMVVAEENNITEIFTNDHHFEQAGYSILLKQ